MNIQRLFEIVDEDQMNSPVSLICGELENLGYKVKLEGVEVSRFDLEENVFIDFQNISNGFEIDVFRNDLPLQKLNIVFTDYHKFIIANFN